MKITTILLLAAIMHVSAATYSQNITLSEKNAPLEQVLKKIKRQTGFDILYGDEVLSGSKKVSIELKNMPLANALDQLLKDLGLAYTLGDQTVVIKKKEPSFPDNLAATAVRTIRGRVLDNSGKPLPKASIQVKGNPAVFTSNENGEFSIPNVPEYAFLVIKYMGFMPVTIKLQGRSLTVVATDAAKSKGATEEETEGNEKSTATMDATGLLSVKLARLVMNMEEVVITGMVDKRKESFTGSAATYTQKELLQVGGTNILQSLKTLDPAFIITDNNEFGSDPNRLPDIEIRGKTNLEIERVGQVTDLNYNPNTPLFILDGFESSLAIINDLNIHQIQSITVLKDAASTAIYGSKAANGVVVVETIKPKAGKLQVGYSGGYNIQAPDLTSYNLMNAAEKLEFERLSGMFDPVNANSTSPGEAEFIMYQLYNDRLRQLADEGVNTYWMSEPLRVGLNQNHSLNVTGGEGNFLFSLMGSYNGTTGVMKGSDRKNYSGTVNLNYRTSKFQFSNSLTVQSSRFQNPIAVFSDFSKANPYYKKTNNGIIEPWLENNNLAQVENPLWDASLNSRNIGKSMQLRNFFNFTWTLSKSLQVNGNFGLTSDGTESERFTSPNDHSYDKVRNSVPDKLGGFSSSYSKGFSSQGGLTVNYAKVINKHRVHLAGVGNFTHNQSLAEGYTVRGFSTEIPSIEFTYPNFSSGFPPGTTPSYNETIARSINAVFSGGYAFNDRFLMDLSLRSSGSSIFGQDRRLSSTWSVGLGWNLHNERFISDMGWINSLRIRGSVGNPGNQNFSSRISTTTYQYDDGINSHFGLAAQPSAIGNPNLEWQTTLDKNIGMNLGVLNDRLSLAVDYHHKFTRPMVIEADKPLSSGVEKISVNAGEMTNQGLNFSTSYKILNNTRRGLLWTVRATFGGFNKTRMDKFGNKLQEVNTWNRDNNSLRRYVDGADPTDIWAIPSLGIDPVNGRELFLTKDGKLSYDYDYNDEVIVGNSRPVQGVVGSNLSLGGFTLNLNFRYQFGAEKFNTALLSKVENVNMYYNQDRRALYDRWHKPGDISIFKNIRDNRFTPASSRFVITENLLVLEGFYASYRFSGGWVRKAGFSNFSVNASTREIFTLSTMQAERGINYPFARSFNAGFSINF